MRENMIYREVQRNMKRKIDGEVYKKKTRENKCQLEWINKREDHVKKEKNQGKKGYLPLYFEKKKKSFILF